jgi:hypothetical protein
MHHRGGYDHSRDGRQRRCDGCTNKHPWAELKEVFDPSTDEWGFWLCQPCLDRLPNVKLVPRRPDWRDDPNNALNVMARSIRNSK